MPTVPGEPTNPYDSLIDQEASAAGGGDVVTPGGAVMWGVERLKKAAGDNPYDTILDQDKQRRNTALAAALQPAAATDPDKHAANLDLAKKTGLPVGAVEMDPASVQAEQHMKDVVDSVSKSPLLQAWYTQDDNAVLAMDDYVPLTGLESAMQTVGDVAKSPFRGFDYSVGQGIQGLGALNDAAARGISGGLRAIGLGGAADALEAPVLPYWTNPSEWARGAGKYIQDLGGPALSEDRQNFATQVGEGLGSLIGQAVATRLNPTAGVTLMAGQGAEQQAEQADAAGADPDQKAKAVVLGAAITAASEKLGLDLLLDRLPPKIKNKAAQWLVDKALAAGIEGTEEGVEQLANNIVAQMIYDPNNPIMAGVADNASIGAAVGGIARALLGVHGRTHEVGKVKSDQTALDGMVAATEASKLAQRAPERFQDLVRQMAQDGATTVYVPVEKAQTLFQSMEPPQIANALGVSLETYMEAVVTGGDVAIPVEAYLTKVAPEHHAELRDFARFTAGSMTPEETVHLEEASREAAVRFEASARDQQPGDERVRDDVTGMLLGTGRYRREDVEKYAQILQAGFRTLGQREGIDPYDLYSQYRLRIKSELPAALQQIDVDTVIDPLIERLRSNDIPKDNRQSLVDFLAEGGGVTDAKLTGELKTIHENDRASRAGKKRLVREDAERDLDRAREAAAEAGYLPADSDVNDLLALIDQEQGGNPVYAQGEEMTPEVETRHAVHALDEELGRRGIDVHKATNAEIKAALFGEGDAPQVPDELVKVFDQPAYHGTPHEVDRFSLQKIGSGEGNQAFGWGLYFASQRDIAEWYRKTLTGVDKVPGGKAADEMLRKTKGDRVEAVRLLKRKGDEQAVEFMRRGHSRGNLYEVHVPEESELLDYDKPLSQQPDNVKAALRPVLEQVYRGDPNDKSNDVSAYVERMLASGSNKGKDLYRDLVNDLGSERAASEALLEAGIPGLRYADGATRGRDDATHNYVIWDESAVSEPTKLFQSDRAAEAIRRGYIKFGGDRQFTIGLLEKADATTFLHETGHFFLEVMGDLAADPNASPDLVRDYNALLNWFGVESREQIGVDQHEQFARGFEAYLGEGKAPTAELAPAFARFKAWVKAIYRSLRNLNVELTDDVRAVFDRMLATDEEISQAEASMDYAPLFADANAAGWTDAEFAARLRLDAEAREQAEERLMGKAMREVTRENKAWWKERSAEVEAEVTEEIHGMPVYRALSMLQNNTEPDGTPLDGEPTKLNKEWLARNYGQEWLNKHLLRKRVYSVTGGADPDIIAEGVGFASGDELVRAMAGAQPMKDVIKAQTHQRMVDRYGDMMTDGSMPEQAMRAVHNTRQYRAMEADLKALERLAGETRPTGRQMRQVAEAIIGQKRVRDLQPNAYLRAERKAAREATQAAGRQQWGVALEAQRRRLLNAHLYDVSARVKDETDKLQTYIKRFQKPGMRSRLGKIGRLEQVDTLLAAYDLRNISGRKIDQAKARAEMAAMIQEGGLQAPAAFLRRLQDGQKTNWRDLTVEELRGLRDVLAQQEAAARLEYESLVNGQKRIIQDDADAVAESIERAGVKIGRNLSGETAGERVERVGTEALNSWLRVSEIARQLDQGEDFGAVTRLVVVPVREAQARLEPRLRKAREDVTAIYKKHYSNDELTAFNDRVTAPEIGGSYTKSELLALALNWGNAENKRALLDSTVAGAKPLTEAGVLTTFERNLDARDWAFVQDVWAYLDTYWPESKALEQRRNGISPKKVEPLAFVMRTKDGQQIESAGGYYRLKYNPAKDGRGVTAKGETIDELAAGVIAGRGVASLTRAGSQIERVGSGGRPVWLNLSVIDSHLTEVIRDVELSETLGHVNKVLGNSRVQQAMTVTGSKSDARALDLWVKDVAAGELAAQGLLEKSTAWIRTGFSKAKMGWKLTTILAQFTGVFQTMVVVGKANFAQGFAKYAQNPREWHKNIMAQSQFMRSRYEAGAWNKDVQDTATFLQSSFGPVPTKLKARMNAISATYFLPLAKSQLLVDEMTWLAGYHKAVTERGLDGDDAVHYADSVVENSQTSGFFGDRSALERGTLTAKTRQSQFVRIWTTLGSYMIAKGNIAYGRTREVIRNPSPANVANYATDMLLLFLMDALAGALIRGVWPDDDEEVPKFVASQAVQAVFGTVPFVREIPAAAYGGGNTPIGALGGDIYKAWDKITSDSHSDAQTLAALKAVNNVGGTLFHYPAAQLNILLSAYWADSGGEDVSPYEYLVSGPDKKK